MFNLLVDGTDEIEKVKSISVQQEDKGNNSIVSTNRMNLKVSKLTNWNNSNVELRYGGYRLFFANYSITKTTKKNTRYESDITIYDALKNPAKKKFADDEVRTNTSITTLVQELAGMLNLSLTIVGSAGSDYVEYIKWEKGKKVIDELKEAIEALNARLFCNKNNTATLLIGRDRVSLHDTTVETFNSTNMRESYQQKNVKIAKYDAVMLEYDKYEKLAKQRITARLSADIRLEPLYNNPNIYAVFEYVSEICVNPAFSRSLITKADGTVIQKLGSFYNEETKEYEDYSINDGTVTYTIDAKMNQAQVQFVNTNDFEVFIEIFEFEGEPVFKSEDNKLTLAESSTYFDIHSVRNKYIQNSDSAEELAKSLFRDNCNDIREFTFKAVMNSKLDILKKIVVNHSAMKIDPITLVLRKLNYSISQKDSSITITADAIEDYVEPSAGYFLNIEEKTPTISSNSTSIVVNQIENNTIQNTENIEGNTTNIENNNTKITNEGVAFARDIGATENKYEIEIENYTEYDVLKLIKFMPNKKNTSACTLNINNLGEKVIKKMAYLLDMQANDIIEDMIVVVNYNDVKDCFECVNPVGLYNTVITVIQDTGLSEPLAIANITKSEQAESGSNVLIRWDDPSLSNITELQLRRKETPWAVSPYGNDDVTTGDLIYSTTTLDDYSATDLVDNTTVEGTTYYYKIFYKYDDHYQLPNTHNEFSVEVAGAVELTAELLRDIVSWEFHGQPYAEIKVYEYGHYGLLLENVFLDENGALTVEVPGALDPWKQYWCTQTVSGVESDPIPIAY